MSFFNSLFWKISSVFLLILVIISAVYIYISVNTAEMYFQETRQNLDIQVASHIASENDCFKGDSVNLNVLKNVFHNVMIINPSIEVYLLDTSGKILAFYAPNRTVKIDYVPLDPIEKFVSSEGKGFLLGVDPKNPEREKAFSAARVTEEGQFKGYIYVILGGQEFENASQMVLGSYILRLGIRSMIIALITAVVIGFVAIGIIVKNIKRIVSVIRDFQAGNLGARIHLKSKSELREFAVSFNDMADTIVQNLEELKKKDHLRRELAANISHDLRTPLTIIRGYAETVQMKDENLTSRERKKYLQIMLSNIDRILEMVNELFELSNLEATDAKPNRETFSIVELMQDIHQKNRIKAEEKDISFTLKFDEHLPLVNADIQMMEKVFQNMLDNAFKFTKNKGNIEIGIRKKDINHINVCIVDSGIGIGHKRLNKIFDRYYQVNGNHDYREGAGLGLAIVKKILELHEFQINVESKEGKGTTFTVTMQTANV